MVELECARENVQPQEIRVETDKRLSGKDPRPNNPTVRPETNPRPFWSGDVQINQEAFLGRGAMDVINQTFFPCAIPPCLRLYNTGSNSRVRA